MDFIARRTSHYELNEHGQKVGFVVPDWVSATSPQKQLMQGGFCRLEPLSVNAHAQELFAALHMKDYLSNWTYLGYGPFASVAVFEAWLHEQAEQKDPCFYAIIDLVTGKAVGMAAYLRIDAAAGVIEVGHLNFSPLMQKSAIATEAMFLMMKQAFEWGYRRYEWKCNVLNKPSFSAATRLGFLFEGIFRQARIDKGRNRDTAWFSILDTEWQDLKLIYESWLSQANFDEGGKQKASLSSLTKQWRECHN